MPDFFEAAFQAHLRHCRFVEARKSRDLPPGMRPPPTPKATIRRGWEAMCLEAGRRKEGARKRCGVPLREENNSKMDFDLGVAKQEPKGARPSLPPTTHAAPPGPPKPPALTDITI